ncbi:antibiotic biosynthesis monooxygenase family protein [Gandjariella thermophila]|uniref:Antibiotic biosynthesis monooxygenase n=1 Tax=Gandjariella thermophila TaxID=1931992 RepID=A0A4D4J9E1_9PSEU|nr:antibiotic biosynthesis monooxygenase family protein [Gandjariella thermophila]GDY31029.1 antibiotic biosynthesis monooxygenase [Gandjariella thermophila]
MRASGRASQLDHGRRELGERRAGWSGGLRVLLYHVTDDVPGIESAYHEASTRLAGVPGLLGNELLRSVHDPGGFVVVSSWRDLAAFQQWERGAEHRDQTAPLRPYRDMSMRRPFGVYQVTASYRAP